MGEADVYESVNCSHRIYCQSIVRLLTDCFPGKKVVLFYRFWPEYEKGTKKFIKNVLVTLKKLNKNIENFYRNTVDILEILQDKYL